MGIESREREKEVKGASESRKCERERETTSQSRQKHGKRNAKENLKRLM